MANGFYLSDHQFKGVAYSQALCNAGYRRSDSAADPELVMAMFDHDVGNGLPGGTRRGLDYLQARGVPVFLYPHAARPMVQYDGIYKVWPHTRCRFAIGPGEVEVMQAFGYEIPMEVVGWSFCKIKRWSPSLQNARGGSEKPIQVLFGPIHPNNNGWLSDVDKGCNQRTYQFLLQTPGIDLTVRHVKRLDLCGLWMDPKVKFILGRTDGSTAEIDQADVVIGHQTFAFMAAARWKAVIMFGDEVTPHAGNRPENLKYVKNYEKYREIMRYPAEVESVMDGNGLRELMERVLVSDIGKAWREKFIGEQFDGEKFVEVVRNYL